MQVFTEDDYTGVVPDHPWAQQFTVLGFREGGNSFVPNNFFRDWLDEEAQHGHFYIGRCSGFGVGSLVKYDAGHQSLAVGRFVAGGLRLKFLLNGQHDMRTISTYMFGIQGMGLRNVQPPQYADSVVKNDIWLGDEMMMLGGGTIENGCVIGARSVLPPNFRSEPYGIYAGSPAKLIRFRFPEKVCEALNALAWWDMPLSWIRDNNAMFLQDMTADEAQALDIIAQLAQSRRDFEAKAAQPQG